MDLLLRSFADELTKLGRALSPGEQSLQAKQRAAFPTTPPPPKIPGTPSPMSPTRGPTGPIRQTPPGQAPGLPATKAPPPAPPAPPDPMRGQSRETGFYQTPRRAPAPVGTARNLPSNAQPATAGGLQAIGRQEMWSPPKEKRPLRRRSPVYTPKPAAKKPEPKPKKRRGSGRKKPFKPRDVGVAWESAPEKATRLSREEASRRELAGQAGNRYGPSRGESQARIAEYNRRMASYKKNPGISPPPKFRTAAERAEWIRQQAFNERQRKRGLRK